MLEIAIRGRIRCPKHPRFNPASGMGAVKGGCWICAEMVRAHRAAEELQRRLVQLRDDAGTVKEALCARGC